MLKQASVAVGGPEDVKLKDLRTIKATQSARKAIEEFEGPLPPMTGDRKKDARALAKAILAISAVVAGVLNNEPTMARDSYVMPQVWQFFEERLKAG